jgi:hypothetical protein
MRVASGLAVVASCVALLCPSLADAQPYEAVGLRALGMGGAFVAVADDASAVYWNPAGLATGQFFSFVFDIGQVEADVDMTGGGEGARAGERLTGSLLALGTPPLGLSYYRVSSVAARVPAGDTGGAADLARLRTSHVGVTLVQTLIEGLHLGGTLKYVHGSGAGVSVADVPDDVLRAASTLPGQGDGAFDVDLGLMADFRRARAGVAVRNLLEPTFALRGGDITVNRQVRAGVAVFATDELSLAADADLTTTHDLTGERRSLAVGAEQRLWRGRAGLRGGVRVSTTGETRTTVTAGGSIAFRTGIYADGYVALGASRRAASGAGIGLRMIF